MANIIIEGDGSWQNSLDAGRCPKCGSSIETQLAPSFKNVCTSCKLVIIDSKARSDTMKEDTMPSEWENEMYETKLMPSEDEICEDQKRMTWQEAVSCIEDFMLKRTALWSKDIEEEERVRSAWKRVLQG